MATEPARLELLSALARKVLWLSSWTIHHANHIRPNVDGLKVGGHQASSASLATIMSALYFSVVRAPEKKEVKPHASPVFHAIQYLFGHQTREKLENFRGFKGAQSYPSRTKDTDDVDFSTGSVGLGVAQTLFASLVQDYVEALKRWIDACPNAMYAALCFQGGAAFRKHLRDEIGDQGAVSQLIDKRSDDELLELMSNLGGHDMARMIEAFESIDHDRPVCFIAYTIKGIGLPFQGHKDNHAGLMTVAQMEKWRGAQNIRTGHEWEKFEGLPQDSTTLQAFLDDVPFNRGQRRLTAPVIDVPPQLSFTPSAQMSTQQGFGLVL